MSRLELRPDGYERIMKKIQSIEDVLDRGFFEPDTAPRRLRDASGELRELRHIIHDVCLLSPDTSGPPGPDAA
jgi:hypothetical protein